MCVLVAVATGGGVAFLAVGATWTFLFSVAAVMWFWVAVATVQCVCV